MEYTIRIGGEAGQGLQLIGGVLAKYLARGGFEVFSHQDYMSRIRGGHNYYQISYGDEQITAPRDRINILLALDRLTIDTHQQDLSDNGLILYDPKVCKKEFAGRQFLAVPMSDIIEELKIDPIMINSVAVGAVLGLLGLDPEPFGGIIGSFIGRKKGKEIIQTNIEAAEAGRQHIDKNYSNRSPAPIKSPGHTGRMLINGSSALGLGALMSGCKFYAAYPMTPSTGIMIYLASQAEKHGIIVEQAEDEIAAINMAIGASFGGVRAMTGTSGGGFALMTEGLSLSGMTETPVVIAEVQRPGPATGLPTRTEQSDLNFVLYAGHGEFPRVVLTPGNPQQAFYQTNRAFHLAEKYQIPVIIQSDQYLADCEWTLPPFATAALVNEDFRLRGEALNKLDSYRRYQLTPSGVSPLGVPGESRHLVVADSDEHDEDGHMIEDGATRIAMVDKRYHRKMIHLKKEIAPPDYHGVAGAKIILIGFGSTWGVMREAVAQLSADMSIGMLHFSEVCPFPLSEKFDYLALLKGADKTICIENNATGQFANLLAAETGFKCHGRINRYDGRPFGVETLLGEIHAHL